MTIIVAIFCMAQLYAVSPVKQWGQLQVKGAQLCDQSGNPVVLRGVSLGWHNIWPRFYNKQAVKWLATDWHANIIRAAMGIQIEDNYLENPDFAMKCITQVVDAAIKNGTYVIIDWHAHKMHTEEAKAFFGKMAQKYGKYPNVLYELYNEPVEDYLRDKLEAAVKSGLPVFVSECAGMEASGNGPLAPEEYQKWLDVMEKNKVSWVNWSVSDKDETCSMLLPRAKATGNWTPDLIKPWGKMVKEALTKYNN